MVKCWWRQRWVAGLLADRRRRHSTKPSLRSFSEKAVRFDEFQQRAAALIPDSRIPHIHPFIILYIYIYIRVGLLYVLLFRIYICRCYDYRESYSLRTIVCSEPYCRLCETITLKFEFVFYNTLWSRLGFCSFNLVAPVNGLVFIANGYNTF